MTPDLSRPIVVIGAGLSGLACAIHLVRAGQTVQVLEAGNHPGGRVWTDKYNGFMLDRGFQVLNPAYPELHQLLNVQDLNLKPFLPGAQLRLPGHQWTQITDPLRQPLAAWETLTSPAGTLTDKALMLGLQLATNSISTDLYQLPYKTGTDIISSADYLKQFGFSDTIIRRFFQPFFGGVLLERALETRADYFQWLFKCFTSGAVCLPEHGMAALPNALVAQLPEHSVRYYTPVSQVSPHQVTLSTDETIEAQAVVVATDGLTASDWLGLPIRMGSRSVTCLYYQLMGPPLISKPLLCLNGQGEGLINNLCFPNAVQASYAPEGQSLLSVTMLGINSLADADLDRLVQAELTDWFGLRPFHLLRIYRIPHAQPKYFGRVDVTRPLNGLWVTGDWTATPSIQGALISGRKAAESLLKML